MKIKYKCDFTVYGLSEDEEEYLEQLEKIEAAINAAGFKCEEDIGEWYEEN